MGLINKIKSWLNKPLPFFETTKQKLIISVIFGVFIIIFLIFFNYSPEGESTHIQILKAFAYGFITFSVLFFYSYLLPLFFPKFFNTEFWTVGKSISYGIILIISIGLVNAIFSFKFDNPNNRTEIIPFLFAVVYRTFIIGIIPSVIFNFWLEKKLYKKYSEQAFRANKNLRNTTNTNFNDQEVIFQMQNKNRNINLRNKDLIFVKSEGNYCQIFYQENSTPQKVIIRNTLKNIEKEIKNSGRILRCHKSYIINLDKVLSIKGNARGYCFVVDVFNCPVPVSRELSKDLIHKIDCN